MGPVTTFPPFFTFWASFTVSKRYIWYSVFLGWIPYFLSHEIILYILWRPLSCCILTCILPFIFRGYIWQLRFLWLCKLESKYKWGDYLAVSPKSVQSPSCLETLLVFCISSFTDESHFFSKFESFSQIRVKPSTALQKMLDICCLRRRNMASLFLYLPGQKTTGTQ